MAKGRITQLQETAIDIILEGGRGRTRFEIEKPEEFFKEFNVQDVVEFDERDDAKYKYKKSDFTMIEKGTGGFRK